MSDPAEETAAAPEEDPAEATAAAPEEDPAKEAAAAASEDPAAPSEDAGGDAAVATATDGASTSLEETASRWAEAAAEDLGGLLGRSVRIEPGEIRQAGRDELVFGSEPVVLARFQAREDADLHVHAVTTLAVAHALAAARLGSEPAESATADDLAGEALDACIESMDLCAAVLGRVLGEAASLPGFEHESTAPLELPLAADAPLAPGDYRRVRFAIALEGLADGAFDLLFSAAQAEAWFGAADADDGDWGRPLAVVDPDAEVREQVEALSEALGRPVWTLDPADYGPDSIEELAGSGAIVVAWDLGGYSGIDLLETLLADPRTRDLPVAMASDKPTRDRVLTALHFGARSFLSRPYDADEIAQRLRNLPG